MASQRNGVRGVLVGRGLGSGFGEVASDGSGEFFGGAGAGGDFLWLVENGEAEMAKTKAVVEKMELAAVQEAVARDLPAWRVHAGGDSAGGQGGDAGRGGNGGKDSAGGLDSAVAKEGLPARDGQEAISRKFAFANFREAFAFMTEVALLAERANHHPEWRNVWREVEVKLMTHSVGGVSEADLKLAQGIDKVAGRYLGG